MDLVAPYVDNSVSHHKSAGVYSENYFKRLLQRGLIFTNLPVGRQVNEAKQKYQNLPQLFSRTTTIPLAILFNLPPGDTPARPGNLVDKDQTVVAKCGDMGPGDCSFFNGHQLVH